MPDFRAPRELDLIEAATLETSFASISLDSAYSAVRRADREAADRRLGAAERSIRKARRLLKRSPDREAKR